MSYTCRLVRTDLIGLIDISSNFNECLHYIKMSFLTCHVQWTQSILQYLLNFIVVANMTGCCLTKTHECNIHTSIHAYTVSWPMGMHMKDTADMCMTLKYNHCDALLALNSTLLLPKSSSIKGSLLHCCQNRDHDRYLPNQI